MRGRGRTGAATLVWIGAALSATWVFITWRQSIAGRRTATARDDEECRDEECGPDGAPLSLYAG